MVRTIPSSTGEGPVGEVLSKGENANLGDALLMIGITRSVLMNNCETDILCIINPEDVDEIDDNLVPEGESNGN